jgi:hypothetical protein
MPLGKPLFTERFLLKRWLGRMIDSSVIFFHMAIGKSSFSALLR